VLKSFPHQTRMQQTLQNVFVWSLKGCSAVRWR